LTVIGHVEDVVKIENLYWASIQIMVQVEVLGLLIECILILREPLSECFSANGIAFFFEGGDGYGRPLDHLCWPDRPRCGQVRSCRELPLRDKARRPRLVRILFVLRGVTGFLRCTALEVGIICDRQVHDLTFSPFAFKFCLGLSSELLPGWEVCGGGARAWL